MFRLYIAKVVEYVRDAHLAAVEEGRRQAEAVLLQRLEAGAAPPPTEAVSSTASGPATPALPDGPSSDGLPKLPPPRPRGPGRPRKDEGRAVQ